MTRPGRIGSPLAGDGVLAAAVFLFLLVGTHGAANGQVPPRSDVDWLTYPLLGLAAGALVLRRRWPFVVLATTTAACTAYLAADYPYGPILFTMSVAAYSVGLLGPPRRALGAICAALVISLVPDFLSASNDAQNDLLVSAQVGARAGLLLVPWAVGRLVGQRREYVARADEERTRHHADEERLRIAREVHDIVGHGLAVINMQAGVALHVLSRRPEQARPSLEAIRTASKDALDELRRTLAVFRHEDGNDRTPTPTLDQVETLVAMTSGHGVPVDLEIIGDPTDVPSAVGLAGYRIVQESLTNVLRHAGPAATAVVRIGYHPSAVDIEVIDTGTGGSISPGGHGIVGMRERAAAVNGTLDAGPRLAGGYRVHAHLPFGEPPS